MLQDDPDPRDADGDDDARSIPEVPVTLREYTRFSRRFREERSEYWDCAAKQFRWETPYSSVVEENFGTANVRWYPDGTLNGAASFFDAVRDADNNTGLIYIDENGETAYSFGDIIRESESVAAALVKHGLKPGDRAALYLPDCPESVFFMLGCSLAGITYVPVSHHYTAEITKEIISDSGARIILTGTSADESYISRADCVSSSSKQATSIIVGRQSGNSVQYSDFTASGNGAFRPEAHPSDMPLFLLYANSAAGIPRGSVFSTGGFLVQAKTSFGTLFGKNGTGHRFSACAVDLATASGQAYGLWGSFLNGSGLILSSGSEDIDWKTIEAMLGAKRRVSLLTSPGTLSSLRRTVEQKTLPEELRFTLIVSSGNVLYPRLITFASRELVSSPEHVLNLWIQSESGSAVIATLNAAELNRSGSLGLPLPGIDASALNTLGDECRVNESGQLVFRRSWPAMITTIWNQHERFKELYFSRIPGYFATNDAVRIDQDGFVWFMGRLDDVVKVRGHSLATSEIEAVLVGDHKVAEAAVVSATGADGDSLVAFVTFSDSSIDPDNKKTVAGIEEALNGLIASRIGEFAVPERYIFARELPKTRTGKLVRRVLRRIASGDIAGDDDLGHVANPGAVGDLLDS